ncbi:DNA polymerase nu-like [Nymphalis io]|uniref:DNA polymerase nu-like n=1 Tax=Inachis io TaxID=171585 RepID=UPI0021674350|nr:DNA polymerase nu-like [Nymphalis io]
MDKNQKRFNESNVPLTLSKISTENGNSYVGNNNIPVVSTSIDLLKTTDFNSGVNVPTETTNCVASTTSYCCLELKLPHQSTNQVKEISNEKYEPSEAIPWNDIFDREIFKEIYESSNVTCEVTNDNSNDKMEKKNDVAFNMKLPPNKKKVQLELDHVGDNDGERKTKNTTKAVEPLKKKSKTNEQYKGISKNIFRKEKYKTTVKNWLNCVDPNNKVEPDTFDHVYGNEIDCNIHAARNGNKTPPTHYKHSNETVFKHKNNKKIIQAQLANKDGIMKFEKPIKYAEVTKMVENSNAKDNNEGIDEKKEKSSKAIKDKKVANNGFSQLNCQHTDVNSVAEGILLYWNDKFYYLRGYINGCTETLRKIFSNNMLTCYEAKDLIIYLKCIFELSFTVLNVIDIKIGSSLLSPDNPPENFFEVQKLIECTPNFTIATECSLQKAAWYITLLKDSSVKLKGLLVENGLWKVFVDIEMKILLIVADMQHRGVSVDVDELKSMENILMIRMKEIESECYKAAGKTFQINSTLQVRAILYDELKLDTKCNVKIRETTSKGAKSTAEAMLRSLTSVHPLPKLILEYRHLHKAHATFLAGIAQHVKDGVVRPAWDQIAAATGRIACNNPNLQAVPKTPFNLVLFPKDGDDGVAAPLRRAYVPRAGRRLLAADFRHAECRVLAARVRDGRLRAALAQPDLFRHLAQLWSNEADAAVTAAERSRTKRLVYASVYGAGARKLMEILDVDYERVLSIMTSFNRTFPSLKNFSKSVVTECENRNGRLTLASGRARTFRNICSSNFAEKSHAERQAVNFIIQGTAADLCKTAMILTTDELRKADPPIDGHLVLQIHDELVWEVLEEHLDRAAAIIKATMENCGRECGMDIALPVAMYRGTNWGELEEFIPKDII